MFTKKLNISISDRYNTTLKVSKPLSKKNKSILNNDKGMATLETVPLLVVFIVLMTYAMGYWGSIHSAILSSMAARTYAFETFRNRSDLTQFRESVKDLKHHRSRLRFHTVTEIGHIGENIFVAQRVPISFSDFKTDEDFKIESNNSADRHRDNIAPGVGRSVSSVNPGKGVNPIWIQIGYGYCLDLECKPK